MDDLRRIGRLMDVGCGRPVTASVSQVDQEVGGLNYDPVVTGMGVNNTDGNGIFPQ